MRRHWALPGLISVLLVPSGFHEALAKDNTMTDDEIVVKNDEGAHRLLLPKDWPVEHAHGVVSPMPTEQYFSMKFGQVRDRFQQLDARLETLEHQLQTLEQENKALQLRCRLFEEGHPTPEPAKEVTDGHETQTREATPRPDDRESRDGQGAPR